MELFHLLDTYWGLQACPPSTVSPRLTSASLCRLPHGPILLPLILLNAATGCVDGRLHGVLGGGEQLEPPPPYHSPHRFTEAMAHNLPSGACCSIFRVSSEAPWEWWWSEIGLRHGRGMSPYVGSGIRATACVAAPQAAGAAHCLWPSLSAMRDAVDGLRPWCCGGWGSCAG